MTEAYGINGSGAVTGYYTAAGGEGLGFVYSGGAYTTLKYPGASGSSVTLGREINGSGAVAAAVVAAPETSTWAMLLAGFAGLGFAGYGQDQKQAVYLVTDHRQPLAISNSCSTETNAIAINASGEVAGDYRKGPKDKSFGFEYTRTGPIPPSTSPGSTRRPGRGHQCWRSGGRLHR